MTNPFSYCELHTPDPDQAKSFYGRLFDWKFNHMETPYGGYTMIKPGSGPEGGMMKRQDPHAPPAWLVYISVDDVEAMTNKAQSLGAAVRVAKTEVPGHGFFTVIADPTGATLALWQSTEQTK